MNTTTNYATSSSMGKDDRILMVWSYLQTKDTFNPLELVKRLGNMNPRTIHNYLTIIQEDQFVNDAYIKHIRQPLMSLPYFVGSKTEDEKVFVQKTRQRMAKESHNTTNKNQYPLHFHRTQPRRALQPFRNLSSNLQTPTLRRKCIL